MHKVASTYADRGYLITTSAAAKKAARAWLRGRKVTNYTLGLGEVDDRYHVWRIPVLRDAARIGEVVVDAKRASVDVRRSTNASLLATAPATPETVDKNLTAHKKPAHKKPAQKNPAQKNPAQKNPAQKNPAQNIQASKRATTNGSASSKTTAQRAPLQPSADKGNAPRKSPARYQKAPTGHRVFHADALSALATLADGAVDLVFTSPPYYNARPEYAEYASYDDYLAQLGAVIDECHRVLGEGRFMVMNISPVLVRRESRTSASRRIAVPFDAHRLFINAGFEFVEHIIWEKPEGAGWATGRGRRFAADRQPLQYKAVPVTEDVLVYRKRSERLIDWNLRTYPDPQARERSRVTGNYERTNIWRIPPTSDRRHPAVFPEGLAERVIAYYSLETDTVLDPYAGLGTCGRVAQRMDRGFVMVERDAEFHHEMASDIDAGHWGGLLASPVAFTCLTTKCNSPSCVDPRP